MSVSLSSGRKPKDPQPEYELLQFVMIEQAQIEFVNVQIQLLVLKEENDLFKEKIGGSAILKRKSKIESSEKFDRDR